MDSLASDAQKPKIFISYSRIDVEIIDQIAAALEVTGYEPLIDRHEITGGEDWKKRLRILIAEADSIIFMLSKNSLSPTSDVISWELAEVEKQSKRLLPVVISPLDGMNAPEQLTDLNQIFFYNEKKIPGSGFGTGMRQLVASLRTDLVWITEHTRIGKRAAEWASAPDDRKEHMLFLGQQVEDAEKWIGRRPKDAPPPTPLHLEFVTASRAKATELESESRKRNEKMKQALDEREQAVIAGARWRKFVFGVMAVASVLLFGFGTFSYMQWQNAIEQTIIANAKTELAKQQTIIADKARASAVSASQSLEVLIVELLLSNKSVVRRTTREVIGKTAQNANAETFKNILFRLLKSNKLKPDNEYRVQLGVLVGLSKIIGGKKVTIEQLNIIKKLKNSPNVQDPTYAKFLDAALKNLK